MLKRILLIFFFFIFNTILLFNKPAFSESYRKPNILLLYSYHTGYKWSDDIHKGTLDALKPILTDVNLHVEHMDMKRYYSENRFEVLFHSLSKKYKEIPIDYIISADDTAFIFLKRYLSKLFADAKVILCGTNYLELKDIEDLDQFYGVTEKADITATLDVMLNIHPNTKNIIIINDITVTGKIVDEYITKAIRKYKSKVNFTHFDTLPMGELLNRVRMLPKDSLILYTIFFKDITGRTFEYNESIEAVAKVAKVPIYGSWDFNLGHGMVGGMLTSGYHQGKAAGKLVRQTIDGAKIEAMPRITESPNRYMFDYQTLNKHKISLKQLPKNSIIINKPVTFFEKHKKVLLYSALSIFSLLMIITALIFNIIMRKKVEKQLQQSARNFKGIFENAIEGLFQSSLDGKFLKVNDSLAKILKCDSPEDVLYSYNDLAHDLYVQPEQRDHIVRHVLDHGSAQLEIKLFCKDSSEIIVLLNCHHVVDEKGRHLYLEGSITDMTEYKKTQEIIIQTEKIISLGGLSAGIAHEIKNPLSSMIQASNVIASRLESDLESNQQSAEKAGTTIKSVQDYLEDREIPQMLTNIIDSGNRAHIIIEDMLSFSKKTIGEFTMESLAEIIEEAVGMAKKDYNLERGYDFNSIQIHYDFPEDTPLLTCSRTKLRQVFFNLLKNGAEAMAEANTENPEIRCSIEHNTDSITLKIKDNGPGINKDEVEQIFEPFYTTKGGKKGTGLGLSIAYFIITENHKGKISVNSTPGNGAQFVLEFSRNQELPPNDIKDLV